jgi:predicted PurR-regulated permease PerM
VDLSARDRSLLTTIAVLLLLFLAFQVATYTLQILGQVAEVLLIFLAAWAVAYLLVPLVDLVGRRTPLGRTGSVGVVYGAILILLALILAFGIPALATQLAAVAERGPEFGTKATGIVVDLQQRFDQAGFRVDLAELYGSIPTRLAEVTGTLASNALAVVAATGALLFNVTLVLLIAFYMLTDGDRLWARFTGGLSEELRSEAELLRQSADRSFGGFLRASLILGVIYGVGTFLIVAPLGVPFAGLLSLFSGLVMIIPFFGPVIATIPVVVTTILAVPDRLLPVFVLLILLQQVTLNLIGPRLMSNVIGIHPLFVFFFLLLGAKLAGFWGVLLAMPVAGIANSFALYFYELARGRRARTEAHLMHETEAAK